MNLKKILSLLVVTAMLLSSVGITALAEEDSCDLSQGYHLYIYNGDGTLAMTIHGEKSGSEFNLRTALSDADTFADNGFLFGITGTPTYVVDIYQDSVLDAPALFNYNTTINGNGYKITYDFEGEPYTLAEGVSAPVINGFEIVKVTLGGADFTANEGKTVFDGTSYYETLQSAVEAVCGTSDAVLYCKPGADVGELQHAPVTASLTVYGNDAYVSGGNERDFDIGNTDPSSGEDITAEMTLTVKNLDGCGAWGTKATDHTVNLVFEDCRNMGKVFIVGTSGTLNITMTECSFEGVLSEAVYSNADGDVTLTDVEFSNLTKAINLNHKADGTQTVTLSGCSFTNCGSDVENDQIPVRILSSAEGGTSEVTVTNCTFSGTPEGGADILLDYGVGTTTATISETAAKVGVEKESDTAEYTDVAATETVTLSNVETDSALSFAEFNAALYTANGVYDGKGETTVVLKDSERSYQNNKTCQFFLATDDKWDSENALDTISVTGVTFIFEDDDTSNTYTSGELQVFANNMTFTDCTFEGTAVSPWGKASSGEDCETAIFTGCEWNNLSGRYGVHQNMADSLTVTDCTFKDCERGIHTNSKTPESITITNNTFTGIGDGYGVLCLAENGDLTGATLNITGNTAEGQVFLRQLNPTATYAQVSAILDTEKNTYGTAYVSGSIEPEAPVYVAQVGETKYASVLEALSAAIEGGASELKILQSSREKMTTDFDLVIKADLVITADQPVTVEFYNEGTELDFAVGSTDDNKLTIGENVRFDLVDRVIWLGYWGNNVDVQVDGYLGGYQIWHGANTAVSSTGTLDSHGEALIMRRDATMTVNGGTVNADYIQAYSGHIVAKDAKITAGLVWLQNNHNYGSEGTISIALDNTEFKSKGVFTAEAGTGKTVDISLVNGSSIAASGAVTTDAATTVTADATSSFTSGSKSIFVAKVGTMQYTSLEEGIIAAAPSGTVEILSDIEVEEWVMFSQTKTIGGDSIITLDMNGLTINGNNHTITVKAVESATNGDYLFDNAENININDITVSLPDSSNGLVGGSRGTLTNVNIKGGVYSLTVSKTKNLTLKSCTFEKESGTAIYTPGDGDLPKDTPYTSTLTIDGCEFKITAGEDGYAVILRGENDVFTNNVTNNKVNVLGENVTLTGNTFNARLKFYPSNPTVKDNQILGRVAYDDATETIDLSKNYWGEGMTEESISTKVGEKGIVSSYYAKINEDGELDKLLATSSAVLPEAEVTNLGRISVTGSEGDYTFGSSYYIYDLIGGTGFTTATEPFDMSLAMRFVSEDTAEEAKANAYGNYTTDFFIKIDGMTGDSFVGDGCYLAGYYPSYGAWVKIPLDGFPIEDGKVYPVITSAGLNFTYEAICASVQDFICGIYLTEEVLEANPDMTVNLTLGLSEDMETAQSASFTAVDDYTYTADDLGTAVATVTDSEGVVTKHESFEEALAAAHAGDTVTLLKDVELAATVNIGKNITIDGNGKTITQAESFAGTIAVFEVTTGANVKFENVTFDAIKNVAVMRSVNATVEIDNCTVQNCEHTQIQGLLRLLGDSTITNSRFLNNDCTMLISENFDGDNTSYNFVVDNCVFEENTADTTAIVYYANGAKATITDSVFKDNAVNGTSHSATIYLGFTEDNVVTGNLFENNTVTTTGSTTRVGGAIFFGYTSDVFGNAFVNNTATNANGDELGQVCTSTYHDGCAIDLSGNYWGGEAPVYGKDYTVIFQTGQGTFALDSYNASYSVNEDGGVTVDNEVEITYAAQVGKFGYTTLAEAVAKAGEGDTVTLLSNITLDEGVTVTEGKTITLDLAGKTVSMETADDTVTSLVLNNGDLTITDSSEAKSGKLSYNYTGTNASDAYNTVETAPGSTLTVKGGTIENLSANCLIAYAIDGLTNGNLGNVEVNIENGVIASEKQSVRIFANSTTCTGTLNISGGELSGRVIVQNANTSANKAVLNITDGIFNTNAYKDEVLYAGGSNGATIDMDSTVSGGTFNGKVVSNMTTGFITGGTFKVKPDESLAADGYEFTANSDGTYGVEEKEAAAQFEFFGSTVRLGNSLSMMFAIDDANISGSDYYAELKHYKESGTETINVPFEEWTADENGFYIIEYPGIPAKHIVDKIEIAIYKNDGTQVSVAREDGMMAYALRTIAKTLEKDELTENDTELLTTLVDMLNYGAAAQDIFGYDTDNLANAAIEEYQKYATSNTPEISDIREYDNTKCFGTTIGLENKIELMAAFIGIEENMYAVVSFEDHYGEAVTQRIEYSDLVPDNGFHILTVDKLVIADANQLVTITVYNGDDTVYTTVKESVNSYLARQMGQHDIYEMTAKFTASAYKTLH